MNKVLKFISIGSLLLSFGVFVTFDCYQIFGFMSCSILKTNSIAQKIGVIGFFIAWLISVPLMIRCGIIEFEFRKEHTKSLSDSPSKISLILGGYLSYESDELRRQFWLNFLYIFSILGSWILIGMHIFKI